jgi:hypothetical protein
MSPTTLARSSILLAGLLACAPATAQWALFEDFENDALGPIDGQDGWDSAGGDNTVAVDPLDPLNRVALIPSSSSTLHRSLADVSLTIPDGTARTLFFRLRVAEKQTFSVGLSHLLHPREYSDFAPEIGMANSTQNLDLRAWDDDGGNYENIARLDAGTWYNLWVRVDTAANTYALWMHDRPGEDATAGDRLATIASDDLFAFRAGDASPLVSFYIKTSGGASGTNFGPVYLDDIHLEQSDAFTLANPLAEVCPGDLTHDGLVDLTDITAFVDAFLAADPLADLNPDGLYDLADVTAFISAFLAGCP